jgi:enoyl-CoA hydratase/carnithine racemase
MRAITIAQVHGYAVGGGLSLVIACDLRVAADDTIFFIPEIDIGVPLGWGTVPRMVREIGAAMTRELIMTCRRFGAAEAKALGMLNRVVPAARLKDETMELASRLIKKPVLALSITKDHINAVGRAMGAGLTGFADRDLFLAACEDPEAAQAAESYAAKALKKKRQG